MRPRDPSTPRYSATFGRRRSASRSRTFEPACATAMARLQAVVDLPSAGSGRGDDHGVRGVVDVDVLQVRADGPEGLGARGSAQGHQRVGLGVRVEGDDAQGGRVGGLLQFLRGLDRGVQGEPQDRDADADEQSEQRTEQDVELCPRGDGGGGDLGGLDDGGLDRGLGSGCAESRKAVRGGLGALEPCDLVGVGGGDSVGDLRRLCRGGVRRRDVQQDRVRGCRGRDLGGQADVGAVEAEFLDHRFQDGGGVHDVDVRFHPLLHEQAAGVGVTGRARGLHRHEQLRRGLVHRGHGQGEAERDQRAHDRGDQDHRPRAAQDRHVVVQSQEVPPRWLRGQCTRPLSGAGHTPTASANVHVLVEA